MRMGFKLQQDSQIIRPLSGREAYISWPSEIFLGGRDSSKIAN